MVAQGKNKEVQNLGSGKGIREGGSELSVWATLKRVLKKKGAEEKNPHSHKCTLAGPSPRHIFKGKERW